MDRMDVKGIVRTVIRVIMGFLRFGGALWGVGTSLGWAVRGKGLSERVLMGFS